MRAMRTAHRRVVFLPSRQVDEDVNSKEKSVIASWRISGKYPRRNFIDSCRRTVKTKDEKRRKNGASQRIVMFYSSTIEPR